MPWKGFSLRRKRGMPDGLWVRCEGCQETVYRKTVEQKLMVCPECNWHFRLSARDRIAITLDEDSFEECFADMAPANPLGFADRKTYEERLAEEQAKTGLKDAAVVGRGTLRGAPVILAVTDANFIMGSMASVVGEKLARAAEMAAEKRLPLISISGSGGGARMMEGVYSLAQMSKTSAAIARLHDEGGLYISVMTNPTMGGVAASFASLGDIILAEPGALVGFSGPRVIWQTIKIELPKGFQRAEFMLEHGFIDMIVDREDMRDTLHRLLSYLAPGSKRRRSDARRRTA
jgi:acetyl-CoA carboxylase carboxyl transferase subunit beta